ncbi:MAG: alpha/beta hydrolase, partial [Chloroflexota bacterium]
MTNYATVNNIQLAYDEHGSGNTTLLLMHGLTANLRSFDGLLKAGLAENYHVIRVDLRGRGHSDKPQIGYHMKDHAADIIGLLDALNLETVTLVGHSFGGLLAMYMAGQFADRLNKIVVIDAGLEATKEAVVEKIRPSLERLKLPIADKEAALNVMRNAPYFADGSWNEEIEAWYRSEIVATEEGAYKRLVYPDGISQAIDHILADDWEAYLRTVKVPALLIHAPAPFGTPDMPPILSVEGAQETVSLVPNMQYQQVSGHHITMIFGDHAQNVVNAIKNFVR